MSRDLKGALGLVLAKVINPKTFPHALVGAGQLDDKSKRSFQLYKGRDASAEEKAKFARRRNL